ncbi:MAG: (bacterio)chlorophyll synthase [Chloracidobacterium sp.]|uniref:UbiA family prenyltransferase n=1 Tax=Chloracidobacterium validum TaxID=2821543 RepID=A0ABX8B4F5_9BACT|nr:(bacterio)chlorophyll synthase [Chloracidobacterium validum]QUW01852.1 UbiA family prenyltransferase [Chloracidobacterium validum]
MPSSDAVIPSPLIRTVLTHLQLLDPVTWLGPWQCFCCGVLAVGLRPADLTWADGVKFFLACGLIGPLLTGFSQSINDYFDRHLDAINDPERPIPAGRISLAAARANFILTALLAIGNMALLYLVTDSPLILLLGAAGLFLAYAYSAPGFRLKENGWFGTTSVGLGYCMVPWLLAAHLFAREPGFPFFHLALGVVNALVAMGLITMNDFKSIEGDRKNNLKTLPVLYGERGAMLIAFTEINLAQVIFVATCFYFGYAVIGWLGVAFFIPQVIQQVQLYRAPNDARLLTSLGRNAAGRSLISQSQSGAHPGFIRFLVGSNLLTVTALTAVAIVHGYWR